MMRNGYKNSSILPLALSTLLTIGCSSETSMTDADRGEAVPLQIELESSSLTRAAIMGTTLPDNSQYGIYVTTDDKPTVTRGDEWFNIPVNYQDGKSTISKDVILDASPHYVYATYPIEKSSELMTRTLDVQSQTDYLYGMAIDDDGQKAIINEDAPKARIRLRHAMALLRFNIFQDKNNREENIVTSISMPEDITSCTINLQTGEKSNKRWGANTIACYVNASPTIQTVEALVIPNDYSIQHYGFCVNGEWIYTSLETVIRENNSYTFDVEIRSKTELVISNPIIVPREDGGTENLTIDDESL